MKYFSMVTETDIDEIFKLRNNPIIRNASFNTSEIPYDENMRYWINRLDPLAYKYTENGQLLGLIKLDRSGDEYTISIWVHPDHQGKGIGTEMVRFVLERYPYLKIVAKVKPDNEKSIKFFSKLGFKEKYIQFEKEGKND